MATAYPGALDSSTQQPSPSSTTDLDASGYEHDVVHTNHSGAIIALETKLGTGTSNAADASDGQVMTRQSDGTTAWESVPAGVSWSGSTANGLATYGSSSSVVSESTATYDGTTLQLTTSGGGLKLDGLNSSNGNTLDDYEEGTWTCALTCSGSGSITVDTGNDLGSYTKVGKVVHVQGHFEVSSVSSPTGTLRVGGLPFTSTGSVSEGPDMGNNMGTVVNLANAKSGILTKLHPGGTFMDMNAGAGGTAEDATLADDVDSGSYFLISGSYIATA